MVRSWGNRLGDSGTGGDRKVKNRWESRQGHNMCEVGGVKGPGSGWWP